MKHILPFLFIAVINSEMSNFLMQILIPAHLVALGLIMLGQLQFSYTLTATLPFVVTYLVAILIQLFVLLHVSHAAIFSSKKYGFDADHTAMPTITSITNLLGTCAMAAVFAILGAINDPNGDVAGAMAANSAANATSLFERLI